MFCVIYRFRVKPGREQEFTAAWSETTRQIREHGGSRGSRLHEEGSGVYVAYAQWPSREAWNGMSLPADADPAPRATMRACCETIETLHELEVVSDLLDR